MISSNLKILFFVFITFITISCSTFRPGKTTVEDAMMLNNRTGVKLQYMYALKDKKGREYNVYQELNNKITLGNDSKSDIDKFKITMVKYRIFDYNKVFLKTCHSKEQLEIAKSEIENIE